MENIASDTPMPTTYRFETAPAHTLVVYTETAEYQDVLNVISLLLYEVAIAKIRKFGKERYWEDVEVSLKEAYKTGLDAVYLVFAKMQAADETNKALIDKVAEMTITRSELNYIKQNAKIVE